MAWFGRKSISGKPKSENGRKAVGRQTSKTSRNGNGQSDSKKSPKVIASKSKKTSEVREKSPVLESKQFDPMVIRKVAKAVPEKPCAPLPQYDEIPSQYGDNLIHLLVRDPYWIYAYWEIREDHQQKTLASLGGDWGCVKSVLRVYDVTDPQNTAFYDIELSNMADHWFISSQPNHSYYVEIGLLHADGRFIALARSNMVCTPRAGMSEIIDEQWMGIDFDKIYALSGGFQVGRSSEELSRMMSERLQAAISSVSGMGAITSGAS